MAYGDDAGLVAWAAARGLTLTGTSAVLRQLGSDYIDATYEPYWTGVRTDPFGQDNAWPRTGAMLGCVTPVPSDLIPDSVVNASYRAAYLAGANPGSLNPAQSEYKREKVDVLERERFDRGAWEAGGVTGFLDPAIDGAMRAFICDATGGFFFDSIGS
jgi:hypothetical protein